jgi:lysophospholipase L1-like esterase
LSKIRDFQTILDGGVGEKVDVAFFKFCFVDVKRGTDVEALFDAYRSQMESLKAKYPHLQFIHVTVPLMTCSETLRNRVKRTVNSWLGRIDERAEDNLARARYNQLLLKEYAGREPIYDLAQIESQRPDGTRSACTYRGEEVFSLAREFSSDGGHLNEQGQDRAAKSLLVLLARVNGKD